ncbi:MAG: BREX system Lon protease-like protein BrxL [Burkholderiaceae bacterium]
MVPFVGATPQPGGAQAPGHGQVAPVPAGVTLRPPRSPVAKRPWPTYSSTTPAASAGLVCQYDVVCFDGCLACPSSQKDGVNIMKGYMEAASSPGQESIRADGSIVLVGNFDVDVEHQQRIGHLFGPLPPEMRDDTAFMDRILLPRRGRMCRS